MVRKFFPAIISDRAVNTPALHRSVPEPVSKDIFRMKTAMRILWLEATVGGSSCPRLAEFFKKSR